MLNTPIKSLIKVNKGKYFASGCDKNINFKTYEFDYYKIFMSAVVTRISDTIKYIFYIY